MTSFVGRDRALREVRELLGHARLVTVCGPGGMGKTRLVVELAQRAGRAFPEGVVVVELASLEDPREIPSAVADALSVGEQSTRPVPEQVVRHLQGRRTLLVLDNCEHVLDAAGDLVGYLLHHVPELVVLTTSREPLGLSGEQVYPLGPLGLPEGERRNDRASVEGSEAVRLLLERTRALVPDFALTEANRDAVVELCSRLDGMPLAIELAAVRLRSLSVEQVLGRLDQRFTLLTTGARSEAQRHRTLWDLVDWSHDLCGPEERRLWARLSVFPSGFDLEAAEAVGARDDLPAERVLDVLDRLVAKSIVSATPAGSTMLYRMLVTMREYGARRLDEAGERSDTRRLHRDHYLRRAAMMVETWVGPHQPETLAAMRQDHANLVAALDWSVSTEGESAAAARLASLLRYHWISGGFLSDGRRWLERVLALDAEPTTDRGAALWVAAWVALIQGDRPAADRLLSECRTVAKSLDDEVLAAHTAHWTGLLQLFSGELERSITSYETAIEVFDRVGDAAAAETVLFQLAMAQTYAIGADSALVTCDRAFTLSEQSGEQWCRAYSLWVAGISHWHLGELDRARAAATGALELQLDFQDGICIALALELLGWVAAEEQQDQHACELSGAAAAVWQLLGTTIEAFGPHLTEDGGRMTAQLEERVGAADLQRLRSALTGLSKLQAIAVALGGPTDHAVEQTGRGPLTAREFEVAGLIAEGMSNRAIADRLVISPRTVDGHVERILAKLEFGSRTQVATWAMDRARSEAQ
jgi:predicted ATPase/DNA-binding CsgD family transcriptional regulator